MTHLVAQDAEVVSFLLFPNRCVLISPKIHCCLCQTWIVCPQLVDKFVRGIFRCFRLGIYGKIVRFFLNHLKISTCCKIFEQLTRNRIHHLHFCFLWNEIFRRHRIWKYLLLLISNLSIVRWRTTTSTFCCVCECVVESKAKLEVKISCSENILSRSIPNDLSWSLS